MLLQLVPSQLCKHWHWCSQLPTLSQFSSPNTTPSSSPYPAHFSSSYLIPSQRLVSLLPHTHTSSPHLPHPAKSSPPHLAPRPAASQSPPAFFSIFPTLCPYLRPTLPMVTAGLGLLPCWFGLINESFHTQDLSWLLILRGALALKNNWWAFAQLQAPETKTWKEGQM